MRIVRGRHVGWLVILATLVAAAVPSFAIAGPAIGHGPRQPAVVRMAPPGAPASVCEVPTGEWVLIRGGGWAAASSEARQAFIDAVPVSMTIDGRPVQPGAVLSTTLVENAAGETVTGYVVIFDYLSRPLPPGSYELRTTFGPTTADLDDGLGFGVLPEGSTIDRARTLVVTPRGHFPATGETVCTPE